MGDELTRRIWLGIDPALSDPSSGALMHREFPEDKWEIFMRQESARIQHDQSLAVFDCARLWFARQRLLFHLRRRLLELSDA